MAPPCTFCGQYEGVFMGTNMENGDTSVVCGLDMLSYSLGMAAAMTEGMTKDQAEAYAEALDAIYANDPRSPKPPAKPPRKPRTKTAEPDAPPDDAETLAPGQIAIPPGTCECGSLTATGDDVKLVCDGCGSVLATADDSAG